MSKNNYVKLIGFLGADAEITYLQDSDVTKFSISTNDGYFNKENQWIDINNWHYIECWRKLATKTKSLKKGHKVIIEGAIKYSKYMDSEGNTKYKTVIVASSVNQLVHNPQ